jgi:hypothetical protein
MKRIIEKIKNAIDSLEKEHSSLLLCALFLREEPLEKWDIVVSASWLNSKEMQSYHIVSTKMRAILDESEVVRFSRIVILDPEDPVVSYLQNLETISNGGYKELKADELSDEFGFTIKKAYLLRSKKNS